jgi:hypothetical protein
MRTKKLKWYKSSDNNYDFALLNLSENIENDLIIQRWSDKLFIVNNVMCRYNGFKHYNEFNSLNKAIQFSVKIKSLNDAINKICTKEDYFVKVTDTVIVASEKMANFHGLTKYFSKEKNQLWLWVYMENKQWLPLCNVSNEHTGRINHTHIIEGVYYVELPMFNDKYAFAELISKNCNIKIYKYR